ncbi:MAG: phosphatase PAP2 family protein [Simkaniaceae bacterium]|nr:phosphatase PAP2 family protein [Simkaniaceae bacterium]
MRIRLLIQLALLIALPALVFYDHSINLLIKELHPALKGWQLLSSMGSATLQAVFWLLLLVFFLLRYRMTSKAMLQDLFLQRAQWIYELLAQLGLSIVVTYLLKVVIGRVRPDVFFAQDLPLFSPFSFNIHYHSCPSSHSVTIAIVALCLIKQLKARWKWPIGALACAIALSRVVLMKHFFSDVVLGLLLAYFIHAKAYNLSYLYRVKKKIYRLIFERVLRAKNSGKPFEFARQHSQEID